MEKKSIFNYTNNITKYEHHTLIFKINNILKFNFARILYTFITKLPNRFWYNVSCINNVYNKLKIVNKNMLKIRKLKKLTEQKFVNNEFTFNFNKTMILTKNETSSIELYLRNALNSKEFIDYLNKITKLNLTKLNNLFLSKYNSGDFLSPHSDKNNGRLAFVINLSLNWKPYYGGNLHFMDEDRKEIIHTLTPSFNNLIIFEVPDNGISHYVSHVIPNLKKSRYAISGWFS